MKLPRLNLNFNSPNLQKIKNVHKVIQHMAPITTKVGSEKWVGYPWKLELYYKEYN
jgi:hypothetical protein